MSDNKRIAVNTLIIYARMAVTTIISLIATRYVLLELGQADYGLYNVVGGIVTMLNVVSIGMYMTTQRFINVEMGKGPNGNLNKVFNVCIVLHIGFANYYVDHTIGVWPQAAGGVPFNACEFQVKGDIITDLHESMAAEQKARSTYDNILRLIKDPDVCDPIKFLRAREIVHYQRFGEALRIAQDHLNSRNFYAFNPGFDRCDSCET